MPNSELISKCPGISFSSFRMSAVPIVYRNKLGRSAGEKKWMSFCLTFTCTQCRKKQGSTTTINHAKTGGHAYALDGDRKAGSRQRAGQTVSDKGVNTAGYKFTTRR